jgi:hypothetical protein
MKSACGNLARSFENDTPAIIIFHAGPAPAGALDINDGWARIE